MGTIIYGLCALTSGLCAWLLLQAHGKTQNRLLLWSGLFFVITTVNNVLLIIDKVVVPETPDLSVFRYAVSLAALGFLLRGLIFESE
jgi:hypothetical protein